MHDLVTVLQNKYVAGWDGISSPTDLNPTKSIIAAAKDVYSTDAHFLPYVVLQQSIDDQWNAVSEAPRLKLTALPRLAALGMRVLWTHGVIDIDNVPAHSDGIEVPDSWRVDVRKVSEELVPGCLRYDTKRGARIIWRLPKPLSYDEYKAEMQRARVWLSQKGMSGDRTKLDIISPVTPYRLPYVLRDGTMQNFWADLREPAEWEPPETVSASSHASPWELIRETREEFSLPEVIMQGDRHSMLTRYAASLRAQRHGHDEIEKLLKEADENRCSPPMTSTPAGQNELLSIVQWACSLPPGPSAPVSDEVAKAAEDKLDQWTFKRGDNVEVAHLILKRVEHRSKGYGPQGGTVRTVFDLGELWEYVPESGRWQAVPRHVLGQMIMECAGSWIYMGQDAKGKDRFKPLLVSSTVIKGVIECIRIARADEGFFQGAPTGIAYSDCFIGLRAGKLVKLPHSAEHRAIAGYNFPWTEDTPWKFLGFLTDIWGDKDPDERDAMCVMFSEWLGVTILGQQPKMAKIALLVGESGSNGKSTLGMIAKGLFPSDLVSHIKPQDMGREYYRAELATAMINIALDVPESTITDSAAAAIKSLASGDPMMARHIRESPFSFEPHAGILIALNSLPSSSDVTSGFWRRWLPFSFTRKFTDDEVILGLHEIILREEQAKIVCWCVRSAVNAINRGRYEPPKSSNAVMRSWRASADTVSRWVDSQTEPVLTAAEAEKYGLGSKDAYAAYRAWCESNGEVAEPSRKFCSRLKTHAEQIMVGTSKARRRCYMVRLAAA